jgi:hypothetical protein
MTILEQPVNETAAKQAVTVKTYSPKDKTVWDSFVGASKNGVFLFNRDYMEYHKDRFHDHSLLFYKEDRLVGLLPANISGDVLLSHGGLTFGGVISAYNMKTPLMMEIFDALTAHCQSLGLKEILYKPTPHIYHSIPAEEDLYALYRVNAKLASRSVSSVILMSQEKRFSDNRRASLRKAKKHNLTVKESSDFEAYMLILEQNLVERHGVKPVHTTEEIKLLANLFPDNIKLYASFREDVMLAGIIIYESPNVAHIQYAANSAEGLKLGAQDIVEEYLINERYKNKRFYDFGISTENQGRMLNQGLIKFKEDFGASAVVYDVYQIVL